MRSDISASTWQPYQRPNLSSLTRCMFYDNPGNLTSSVNAVLLIGYTIQIRIISLPLPTNRLAFSALRALQVDQELSPYVRRDFELVVPDETVTATSKEGEEAKTVLKTTYRATTNRMLRVAVNGFMESLGVVLGVMEELDVDVLKQELGK